MDKTLEYHRWAQLFIEENVDPKTLPWIGGGTSDNASAARLELRMTFNRIMDKCESKYEEEVEDGVDNPSPDHMAWGVKRKPIVMFDAPHIDNICVNAASTVFSGLPEKGKHDQYHPMQLLQSIHDLHSQNRKLSQHIIEQNKD